MVKFKIIHFKKDCISCGACAAVNPDFWSLDNEGLAQLKGAKEIEDHWELEIDSISDMASNKESAEVCPVGIIKIEELK